MKMLFNSLIYIYYRGRMSLFLMENQGFFNQISAKISLHDINKIKNVEQAFNNEDSFLAELRKIKEYSCCQSYSYSQRSKIKKYSILVAQYQQYFQLVLTITIVNQSQMSMQLSFLQQESKYFKFDNKHRILDFIRRQQYFSNNGFDLYSMSVNNQNGQLRIIYPTIISQDTRLFARIVKSLFVMRKMNYQNPSQYLKLIQFIDNISELKEEQPFFNDKQRISNELKYDNLSRYYNMMMTSNIIQYNGQSQRQIKNNEKAKIMKIRGLIEEYQQKLQPNLMNSNKIYQGQNKFDCLKIRSQYEYILEQQDIKRISFLLAMPYLPKPKNPNDNNLVLNYVKLQNPESLKLQKINQGGFTFIYLAEISFQYVHSDDGSQLVVQNQYNRDNQQSNQIHKFVVIKQEKPCTLDQLDEETYNRNEHQITILKRIKFGTCIFLPKYYFAINSPKFLSKSIYLDFIPFKNLRSFVKASQKSLSLISKLYFLFSIVQALRYISDFKIVHLDLKPTNIMVFCNMLIKLIDFGESYHPDVCKYKKYQPGFTIPYSSPEVLNNKQEMFSSKSDVFSFGIIMYELLYNKFPYFVNNQTESIYNEAEDYIERWYFTPEQTLLFGHKSMHRILNSLISKCMSKDPKNRPQLDWIGVILRYCIEILIV